MIIFLDWLYCRIRNALNRAFFHGPSLDFTAWCQKNEYCFDKDFYHRELKGRPIAYIESVRLPVGILRTALLGKKYLMRDSLVFAALKRKSSYLEYLNLLNEIRDYSHADKDENYPFTVLALIETPSAKFWPIIVNQKNVILDGQHRACSYLFKYGQETLVDCIRVFTVPVSNIKKGGLTHNA